MASAPPSSLLLSLPLLSAAFCLAVPLALPVGFHFSPSVNSSEAGIAFGRFDSVVCLPLPAIAVGNSIPNFTFGVWFTQRYGVYDIYLGVCRIQALNPPNGWISESLRGRFDTVQTKMIIKAQAPSSAVPVWTANANRPLNSLNASLVVGQDHWLKLKDFDGTVVWNVTNVASMEVLDSGNLVMYNSSNVTVWQSFDHPQDVFVLNQSLQVGMRLISNDSRYSMAMEPGGLVFYLLSPLDPPLPYWIIPAISQAPCGAANDAHAILRDFYFMLDPGSCLLNESILFLTVGEDFMYPCDFVRLETDGRLHVYLQSATDLQDVFKLDTANVVSSGAVENPRSRSWGMCDVPLACGPYDICSVQDDSSPDCVCPSSAGNDSVFSPSSADCQLSVPNCTTEGDTDSQTSFLEINNTATILLFSGTTTNGLDITLDHCKQLCKSNCSCPAIIYMKNTSMCFPVPINVSFLNVSSSPDYSETAPNYVAYLKVLGNPPKESRNTTTIIKEPRNTTTIITVSVVVSVFTFVLLAGLVACQGALQRCHSKANSEYRATKQELLHILPCLPSRFSYRNLHKATGGFNNLLGEGGFGAVYAGVLLDGRQVAVKKLGITKLHGKQFLAEVATIGQTSRFNIVPLIGFCFDISNRLLVYEYMENGSLDQWLFNAAENEHLLDWATRFNVAIGIARGLAYLHGDCPNPILHLDIKPQNILLDKNFVPKLADFGLSRLISRDISQVVTMGRGTPGYIAPELCLSQAAVSKKSDVYSLGMVLLEIVGGRKNIDVSLLLAGKAEEWHFPSWAAKNCTEGKIADLVDARLQGAFQTDEARRMILAAMWCIQENPSLRPSAATVSKWLGGSGLPIEQPSYATVAYSRSQLHLSITRSVRQSDTIL